MRSIYLDHNATTPTRNEVAETVAAAYRAGYANPASQHRAGQQARKALEDARERIALLLGANLVGPQADRLIFTASATEANNLALLGMAGAAPAPTDRTPPRVLISAIEHQSVIEPAEHLAELGWRLDALPVTPTGVARLDAVDPFLSDATRLASVMLANHDTGVVQPVAELAALCRQRGTPLHTDAVQAVGKMPVHFRELQVAALSFAPHKFGGPLGIGGLLLTGDAAVAPVLFGGPQQHGLRPGTECIPLVLGTLRALELCAVELADHIDRLTQLRERFEQGLAAAIPGVEIHGKHAPRLPQTSSVALPGVDAQVMLVALSLAGVDCSVGSACSSGSTELSPTLQAMGLPLETVRRTLRFSLGWTTTAEEIDEAVGRIAHVHREIGDGS